MNLDTLVDDIYGVLEKGKAVSKADADKFGKDLADLIVARLEAPLEGERKFTLRMSNIGKGSRQLWYDKHYGREETLDGKTLIKFLIGDITEAALLFLAEQSGHAVTHHQDEVCLSGVKGHIDADIDGVTVDVKSASPYAFNSKFKRGNLADDDAFGYMEQAASYSKARNTDFAFLAMDKVSGELALLPFKQEELAVYDVEGRIAQLKVETEQTTPPERCYPDQPYGESGNRALGVNCSYCSHKERCWADANGGVGLRTFIYANKPVFMTEVKREPKVYEKTF